MARDVVILGAARTPIGRFLGGLAGLKAGELGGFAVREAVKRSGVDTGLIDEIIMGNVCSAAQGQAPARQAGIRGGLPPNINAYTVNKVCGSGLKAVALAAQAIRAGDAQCVVAGGMESMSRVPFYLNTLRNGQKLGHAQLQDGMIYDGIWCVFEDVHMGVLGEFTAERAGITRAMQDEWAAGSHAKAVAAIKTGKFRAEIVPVEIVSKKGTTVVDTDEGPRADSTLEALAKLPPVFKKDGTITAGNASSINDGGAALVVAASDFAQSRGYKPIARILGYSSAHVEPKMLFFAPPVAVRALMKQIGAPDVNYFDLVEINEAFSSQTLADGKELGWDWQRVNVNGGAVALGHPIGASGARILITLIHALKDRGLKRGLATLCLGGGGSVALAVEVL